MTAENIKNDIAHFKAELQELDAQIDQLEAADRITYERERDDLKGQLDAWEDMAEAQWDEWLAKLKQRFYEFRERWSRD